MKFGRGVAVLRKRLRILSVSGSIMAFHVGSGFASGQEILQFYTSYGPLGGFGMGLLAFFFFSVFGYILLETGRRSKEKDTLALYRQLSGKGIGTLFYWLTPLLMSLVFCVTIAGGGTTLQVIFGISSLWGRILIAVPVLVTVLLGLRWITVLSGSIGPIIILCAFCLGAFGIVTGRDTMLWSLLPHTSNNWWVSAGSYACFGTITQIPFLLAVGAEAEDARENATISVLGNGGFMLTGTLLHFGLYRTLPYILGEQLPALELAGRISGLAWWFYGLILLFSIYTTAVPLLWSVCKTLHPQEKSIWYRVGTVVMTVIACIGARLPFDRLLGIFYPYIGYVSAVFFFCMLMRVFLRSIQKRRDFSQSSAAAVCKR